MHNIVLAGVVLQPRSDSGMDIVNDDDGDDDDDDDEDIYDGEYHLKLTTDAA